MERVGGVYKCNVKGVVFLIGIIIVVAVNVDMLNIIDYLLIDFLMWVIINYYF